MRICLFGGTGFLGRHVIADADRVPGLAMRVVSRTPDRHAPAPNVTYVRGDLLSLDSLHGAIGEGDIVVNLAYLKDRPAEDNLKAIDNLLDAALNQRAALFLHCSTAVVVGRTDVDVVTETTATAPAIEYERVKLEIERRVLDRLKTRIRTVVVRPTAIIGRGGENLVPQIESVKGDARWKQRAKMALFAGRTMNMVCVENVVSAIEFLLSYPPPLDQEVFIVSDDDSPQNTYPEVMNVLAGRPPGSYSSRFEHRFLYRSLMAALGRSDTNLTRRYSSAKLKALGWTPRVEFADGLRRAAEGAGLGI
jgi:nucleoside-diphosphate-sugar epimerase